MVGGECGGLVPRWGKGEVKDKGETLTGNEGDEQRKYVIRAVGGECWFLVTWGGWVFIYHAGERQARSRYPVCSM